MFRKKTEISCNWTVKGFLFGLCSLKYTFIEPLCDIIYTHSILLSLSRSSLPFHFLSIFFLLPCIERIKRERHRYRYGERGREIESKWNEKNVNKESFLHNLIFTVSGYFLFVHIFFSSLAFVVIHDMLRRMVEVRSQVSSNKVNK